MGVPNAIGTFILMEDEHLMGFEQSTPHMLVDLDLSKGLSAEL